VADTAGCRPVLIRSAGDDHTLRPGPVGTRAGPQCFVVADAAAKGRESSPRPARPRSRSSRSMPRSIRNSRTGREAIVSLVDALLIGTHSQGPPAAAPRPPGGAGQPLGALAGGHSDGLRQCYGRSVPQLSTMSVMTAVSFGLLDLVEANSLSSVLYWVPVTLSVLIFPPSVPRTS
jgi:hypothetical protein